MVWKGYPPDESSWEPAENIELSLISDYELGLAQQVEEDEAAAAAAANDESDADDDSAA